MDETRIIALETHSTFQERTIHDLSEVVCRQQQEIDRLKRQLQHVIARIAQAEELRADKNEPEIQTPPHY